MNAGTNVWEFLLYSKTPLPWSCVARSYLVRNGAVQALSIFERMVFQRLLLYYY